jgi:hypothetical protein
VKSAVHFEEAKAALLLLWITPEAEFHRGATERVLLGKPASALEFPIYQDDPPSGELGYAYRVRVRIEHFTVTFNAGFIFGREQLAYGRRLTKDLRFRS